MTLAEILNRVTHPNVVAYRAMGEVEGTLYFVMEYVEGEDLRTYVKERGPIRVKLAVRVVCQVLQALTHAHDLGFVHRDVKPSNVILTPETDGRRIVKLLDFGLARVYQASQLSGLTLGGLIKAFGMNRYRWSGMWRPVVAWFAAYAGIAIYIALISQLNIDFLIPESTLPSGVLRDDAALAMAAVTAVIAAPIAEEVFFRGFLFGGLTKWGFWPAAAIS